MRSILCLLFILICAMASAQGIDSVDNQGLNQKYWAVKWRATELSNPIKPTIQFGMERRWGKYAVEVQAGYTIPIRKQEGVTEGTAGRMELRRYFLQNGRKKSAHLFAGLQGFYNYYTAVGYDGREVGTRYNHLVTVQSMGIVPVMGVKDRIGRHWMIEVFAGLGYKYRWVSRAPFDPRIMFGQGSGVFVASKPAAHTFAIPVGLAFGYYF